MVSLVNIFNQILYYKNVENVFKSFQSKPFIRFCNISRFYGNNPTVSGCFLTKSAAFTGPWCTYMDLLLGTVHFDSSISWVLINQLQRPSGPLVLYFSITESLFVLGN